MHGEGFLNVSGLKIAIYLLASPMGIGLTLNDFKPLKLVIENQVNDTFRLLHQKEKMFASIAFSFSRAHSIRLDAIKSRQARI
ncbi:hypothetical protein D1013_18880 [Euzebyella marina]|uniref:Uncharacterized protein n=1 Tax=Euzebyella marina TaxID=1761453 RepID=A0A3G2LAK7_9FLAO|nr:hypothetical protein D1013_18880 [Euzebyella marina]